MNRNTKILAVADFAVARGDYRRGSKNYEAYISSLMELPQEEIDRRYKTEVAREKERKQARQALLHRQPDSQTEWNKHNSWTVSVKLMSKGDADIIAALEGKQVSQEIRRLLRLGIAADQAKEDGTQ